MAVVYSRSQAERIHTLLDNLQSKLGEGSGDVQSALESDFAELRSSINDLLRMQGEEKNAARMEYLQVLLSQSKARYRELGENLSDPLVVFGPDLRLIYRNGAAEQASSIPNEQALGKTFEELFPNITGSRLHEAFLRAVNTRQIQTCLNHWVHPETAEDYYYDVTFYPEHDWIVAISKNVTDRENALEALRQSEIFNRQLIESSSDSIKVLNMDGSLISVNSAGLRLLEMDDTSTLVGRNWLTLWDEKYRPVVQAAVAAANRGQVGTFQAPRKSFQGKELWWDVVISPIHAADETVERLLVVSRNITDRKRAEAALQKSEEKFSRAFHASPVAMAITRLADGRYIDVNEHTCRLLGYTREEMLNKTSLELNISHTEGERKDFLELLQAQGRLRDFQRTINNRAGDPITVLLSFEIIEVDGEDCILATMIDITEQKRFETEREALVDELRVQKDLLGRLIEFSPIGIAMLKGPEHRFVLVNSAQRALFPTITEFVGQTVEEVWPEMRDTFNPVLDKVFQTGEPFNATDAPWITDKGSGPEKAFYSFSYTALYAADGTIEGILVLSKETTQQVRILQQLEEELEERKEAESALAKAHNDLINERNRLLAVMESLPVGLAILDEKGGIEISNPGYDAVWGAPRPPANSVDDYDVYKAWWVDSGQRVSPEEWAAARTLRDGQPVIGQYLQIQRFDGILRYVMNSAAPVRDSNGRLVGGAVAILDITERVEIERALQESQERFRVALSSVPLLVYTCDRDLRYTWVYNTMQGYQGEQVLGKRDDDIYPAETVAELIAAKQIALETGQGAVHEIKLPSPDGDRFYILTTDPVKNPRGSVTGLLCSAIDITEQKRMEIERQEAQMQMEVQRRLMDQREKERQGIARDIHDGPIQTLASTAFNIQILKESFPDPTLAIELNQIALNVKSATRELREVVNDLRPPSILRFGLSRAIMMHAEDLRERYPDVMVELALDEEGTRLSDPACLTLFRVFQEGMNNIYRHAGATQVWIRYETTPDGFVLELRDNGSGFLPPKDFSGLAGSGHYGLAGMNERVAAVGGTLTIASQPGQGTTITVRGPLTGGNVK